MCLTKYIFHFILILYSTQQMSSAKIKTSITYNEHVSVALIIQHAMHMVPYCHLWPVRPFIIFPHNLVSIMILKKIWTQMCVSIFSSTYVWSIFRSKKNWLRYNQNNKLVFMNSTCCYFDIVMEIEFTWQFFWKILIPFHETPSGSRIVPSRWTDVLMDRHDESIRRFSLFCKCA